ncbi:MAG: aromatic ring-hydroxylating oxygenase subunit alpha [Dehalococcoidia bacterium]
MRSEVHPISGATYEELGEGRIRVSKGASFGVFDWEGHHFDGAITHADPHFLQYVGGPTLPAGIETYQAMAARTAANSKDEALNSYAGAVRDPRMSGVARIQRQQPVAKYVGDPGRDTPKGKRSKGIAFHELLAHDSHPERVPDTLKLDSPMPGGVTKIPTERYFAKEWHDIEVEKIWKRVWQYAAMEQDIPEVGDYIVYDIAHLSYIVVRTGADEFKAFNNACLHRGRLLREFDGKTATEFRCAFHGWSWEIDGRLREIPSEWDFPEVRKEVSSLREVKLGRWGGFIFINPDPDAESLESFLGDLPEHYARFEFEKRYKQMHVAKIIKANWKATQEAFMEGYHVLATHPQALLLGGDGANHQYDVFGNWCRAVTTSAAVSPHRGVYPSDEEVFDLRRTGADMVRDSLRPILGEKVDRYCDAELVDGYYNNLFPNFHPWGAFSRIVYRFRPYGDDPNRSIMEVAYLVPWPEGEPMPPAAPIHWISEDEDFTVAPEMGPLARVLNQDTYNLPKIQAGMKAKVEPTVYLSAYAEGKVRHFHSVYDQWVGRE